MISSFCLFIIDGGNVCICSHNISNAVPCDKNNECQLKDPSFKCFITVIGDHHEKGCIHKENCYHKTKSFDRLIECCDKPMCNSHNMPNYVEIGKFFTFSRRACAPATSEFTLSLNNQSAIFVLSTTQSVQSFILPESTITT